MQSQRVRDAENPAQRSATNGPLRAQGKEMASLSILRRYAHVSCEGYVGILQSVQRIFSANQGGTAVDFHPSLTFMSRRVFFVFSSPPLSAQHYNWEVILCFILR